MELSSTLKKGEKERGFYARLVKLDNVETWLKSNLVSKSEIDSTRDKLWFLYLSEAYLSEITTFSYLTGGFLQIHYNQYLHFKMKFQGGAKED